jgi:CRISPR type I-E-associated protein CasB/Cse2
VSQDIVTQSETTNSDSYHKETTTNFIHGVLELRNTPAIRAALRRCSSPATEYRAYGYLAWWWNGKKYLRPLMCAFAGLAATVPNLSHDPNVSVGKMAAELVKMGVITSAGVERKLLAMQSANIDRTVSLVRPILKAAEHESLKMNYEDLYWILWSSTGRSAKHRSRRLQLLEDYYQALWVSENQGTTS